MATDSASPTLADLTAALDLGTAVIRRCAVRLAETAAGPDAEQVLAYDLAHGAAGLETARAAVAYASQGEDEKRIALVFAADVLADLVSRTAGRERAWGCEPGWHACLEAVLSAGRAPALMAEVADRPGVMGLDPDFEMVRAAFARFADERVAPLAGRVHRENTDVPEEIIAGVADMGGFGLSVPEGYGGSASGGERDLLAMVVATEELSRASLGAAGSLITRPEILTRALVKGGTEEQRRRLLPRIASGEVMVAVAVTEPDHGSDVASISTTATPCGDGGWLLNGVKTWCTFAARAEVLMVLARTDPDRSRAHRGLSVFAVEKPRGDGSGFVFTQKAEASLKGATGPAAPGRLEGRPIDTIGYRGMHSYELAFDNWWVPDEALIGGKEGRGRGFYLQMESFENGRLQTAARPAIGVMQAAYEAALAYAHNRMAFGRSIYDYQLTRAKLGRMAAIIQASRQFAYKVAAMMARGEGSIEASMVKAYTCRAAQWVTRESMQIHGGMGYAEEFAVSRLFVDARVLPIFEGADEVLCLKVIARRLVEQAAEST